MPSRCSIVSAVSRVTASCRGAPSTPPSRRSCRSVMLPMCCSSLTALPPACMCSCVRCCIRCRMVACSSTRANGTGWFKAFLEAALTAHRLNSCNRQRGASVGKKCAGAAGGCADAAPLPLVLPTQLLHNSVHLLMCKLVRAVAVLMLRQKSLLLPGHQPLLLLVRLNSQLSNESSCSWGQGNADSPLLECSRSLFRCCPWLCSQFWWLPVSAHCSRSSRTAIAGSL